MKESKIDEIFKSSLGNVEVPPAPHIKMGLAKQVSAMILKKTIISAVIISSGAAAVGITGMLVYENYVDKEQAELVADSTLIVNPIEVDKSQTAEYTDHINKNMGEVAPSQQSNNNIENTPSSISNEITPTDLNNTNNPRSVQTNSENNYESVSTVNNMEQVNGASLNPLVTEFSETNPDAKKGLASGAGDVTSYSNQTNPIETLSENSFENNSLTSNDKSTSSELVTGHTPNLGDVPYEKSNFTKENTSNSASALNDLGDISPNSNENKLVENDPSKKEQDHLASEGENTTKSGIKPEKSEGTSALVNKLEQTLDVSSPNSESISTSKTTDLDDESNVTVPSPEKGDVDLAKKNTEGDFSQNGVASTILHAAQEEQPSSFTDQPIDHLSDMETHSSETGSSDLSSPNSDLVEVGEVTNGVSNDNLRDSPSLLEDNTIKFIHPVVHSAVPTLKSGSYTTSASIENKELHNQKPIRKKTFYNGWSFQGIAGYGRFGNPESYKPELNDQILQVKNTGSSIQSLRFEAIKEFGKISIYTGLGMQNVNHSFDITLENKEIRQVEVPDTVIEQSGVPPLIVLDTTIVGTKIIDREFTVVSNEKINPIIKHISIPFGIEYSLLNRAKNSIGLKAGVNYDRVVAASGYFYDTSTSKIEDLHINSKELSKSVFSINLGLSVRKSITKRLFLIVNPTFTSTVTDQFKSEIRDRRSYSGIELKAGLQIKL